MNTPHAGGFSDAPRTVAADAPQTLQDAPWRCFWGSHLLRRPLGMHHIVKVLVKFAVFRFLFQKNDLVVAFLGAGFLLETKRS